MTKTHNRNRRRLVFGSAAFAVLAATGLPLQAQARRGGTLRLGLAGAGRGDSWDARTHRDTFMIVAAHGAVFDCLTEIAASGELVGELAESWEASPDAKTWTLYLRRGVRFHNGKPFGADDVIASLNLHRAHGSGSPAKPIVETIAEMRKLGEHQLRVTLNAGNADFPFLLADYHLLMYPAGQIVEAMAKGIGTGLYRAESLDPGVRAVLRRVGEHYKDGKAGWFDAVELVAINDDAARMNAVTTGVVDAVNRVDVRTLPALDADPAVSLVEVAGNQHFGFPMRTDRAPFDNVDVRRALKHAVDRDAMVRQILTGHGRVGNDTPIGPANQFHAADLPQTGYDPDRARFFLRKAGLDRLAVDLSVSPASFPGAVDAAELYRATALAAGIDIRLRRDPAGGQSSDRGRGSWRASSWSGRVTEDWMFSMTCAAGAPWNETRWDRPDFHRLLLEGRATFDPARRAEIYGEMQAMLSRDGGAVIPVFANFLAAVSARLANAGTIGNVLQMDSGRFIERWWFA